MEIIRRYNICELVDNVDSQDIDKIDRLYKTSYDFIFIAILSYALIGDISRQIINLGIDKSKILRLNTKKNCL